VVDDEGVLKSFASSSMRLNEWYLPNQRYIQYLFISVTEATTWTEDYREGQDNAEQL